MGRPRAGTHAVPTPERILDAAEAAFGEHTYADARLADIARVAGVRRPSLLYHFESKELLHTAVVERLFADIIGRFERSMVADATPAEIIDQLFVIWVGFIADRPAFAPLVVRGIIDGQGPVREQLRDQLVPLLNVVEQWIHHAGVLPSGMSARAALLQIGSDTLLRASSGPLEEALWGTTPAIETVRRLFDLPARPPESR